MTTHKTIGRILIVLMGILSPSLLYASSYHCGDTTRLEWYREAVDPAAVPACPAPYVASKLPDDDPAVLAQQSALYASVKPKYLKVVSERMVEMTQAEKDAVDAPAQAKAAATAVANNEMKINEVCANHTLQEITDYWKGSGGKQAQLQSLIQTLDDAIALIPAGAPRNAIQASRDAHAGHMSMFVDNEERQWRYICSHGALSPFAKGP